MGKKFMGLGGTDHFWDRAKAWILNQITSTVAAKIAEIVANAPEDLDTLKEIADWIKTHANDAAAMNTQITENKNNIAANTSSISAMNTQITENKNNIAANTSDISALKTSVAGKSDIGHTHSAGDITSGTLPIANGGTGASDGQGAFDSIVSGVRTSSKPEDNEKMLFRSTSWYKTTCLDFWNYIKDKISNSLGVFIKSKTVTVGNITIPSDNYLEIDVGLTSSDTVISAKLSSWGSNTGVFSIICYAKNRVFIVGNAGTTIVSVSVQAIYI